MSRLFPRISALHIQRVLKLNYSAANRILANPSCSCSRTIYGGVIPNTRPSFAHSKLNSTSHFNLRSKAKKGKHQQQTPRAHPCQIPLHPGTRRLLEVRMSALSSSPADTDPPLSESLPSEPATTASTAPSSVTSEGPTTYSVSPALNPLDDIPTPKLRLFAGGDDKLASREPEAPVPSDFPGKKPERSAHTVTKGDFESDKHFYARCRMSPRDLCSNLNSQRTNSSDGGGILQLESCEDYSAILSFTSQCF